MPEAEGDLFTPQKIQLLRQFGWTVAAFSLVYSLYSWYIQYPYGTVIMGVNCALLLLLQQLIRRVRTRRAYLWCANVFLGINCFVAVLGSTYFSGGLYSPVIPWFALVPVSATLLFGFNRNTLCWVAVALTCVLVFSGLEFVDIEAPVLFDYRYTGKFFAVCLAGFVLLLFLMTQMFETAKNRALRESLQRNEELRVAHAEVKAAYLAKSRFLAAASHDLRQPAHALGMFVSRLTQTAGQVPSSDVIHGVAASVTAMQELLEELFDYSRLESQSGQLEPRALALQDIFRHLDLFFTNIAHSKGLQLRIRPTRTWVRSDPILLQRILLNLVSNALQYTQRGRVLVACRPCRDGKHVRIEVRDSGIGIDPSLHDQVFEEFFQVQNPERDSTKGLGLGLSMVDRSCKLLGHPLALESKLGQGTRLVLTVPVAAAEPSPAVPAAEVEPSPLPHDVQDRRIWVIEDNALGGLAIKTLLESWGASVRLFEEPDYALHALGREQAPEFVICDYRLRNGQTGIDSIRALRLQFGSDLPACLISGDIEEDLRATAVEAGLVLLKKPVQAAKLRSVLRHGLKTRPASPAPAPAARVAVIA
ncbi:MAG: response regulator [Betaproteobacteria bacterium]|nr:response regulator [Betaproteobacteria bacterium]